MRTNQTGAMEKLRKYRQKGVGIFIETLKYLLQFESTRCSKDSQHMETTPTLRTANKWSSFRKIGAFTERYLRADF